MTVKQNVTARKTKKQQHGNTKQRDKKNEPTKTDRNHGTEDKQTDQTKKTES